jgi:hypothetical protein
MENCDKSASNSVRQIKNEIGERVLNFNLIYDSVFVERMSGVKFQTKQKINFLKVPVLLYSQFSTNLGFSAYILCGD